VSARRSFLAGSAAALAAALLGGLLWRRRAPPAHPVARAVREELPFLSIEEAELARFVADYERAFPRFAVRWERAADEHERREIDRRLAADFLMSSDFFVNGADERRPVRHVALYDPRRRACRNPFARFDAD
jgi:hypothetical protein